MYIELHCHEYIMQTFDEILYKILVEYVLKDL